MIDCRDETRSAAPRRSDRRKMEDESGVYDGMTENTLIVGLGEILWDVFPDGPRFGGAPANFACSAAAIGGDRVRVAMASGVGRDLLGERAIDTLRDKSVDTRGVMRSDQPTGQVIVQIDELGQAAYEFAEDTAWDHLTWSDSLEQLAQQAHVCCFGTLAQRSETSRQTIQRFVARMSPSSLRIFDINLRPPYHSEAVIAASLQPANVLKLNDDELPVLAEQCQISGDPVALMRQLAERFELDCVALTRGPEGAILVRGEEISQQAGVPTTVVDTVGAGDAFTATLAWGLVRGWELEQVNRAACRVAAFVCSQPGATPPIPADILS